MKTVRHALCALLVIASLLAPSVRATSFSTDQSDLYYIQAESGWGMQIVQRGSVIFATLFVYDPSGAPTWYVATMNFVGSFTWTGDLYATTGPWFGTVPFNPANVHPTKVGTMTWTAQTIESGNVSYTVNGVAVSKNVIRQLTRFDDFSGHFGGVTHRTGTGCTSPASNGTTELTGLLYIVQNVQAITMQSSSEGVNCTYSGTLSQAGQMGSVQATFMCTDGTAGNILFNEMQVNISGLTMRFAANYTSPAGCQSTGWFGGLHGTTF